MKIHLISDNIDTETGLRLVGINGTVVSNQEEYREELMKTFADKEIGILLITENLARQYPEIIDDIKLNRKLPLVVEIPDGRGAGRGKDFLTAYIKEAIGVKL